MSCCLLDVPARKLHHHPDRTWPSRPSVPDLSFHDLLGSGPQLPPLSYSANPEVILDSPLPPIPTSTPNTETLPPKHSPNPSLSIHSTPITLTCRLHQPLNYPSDSSLVSWRRVLPGGWYCHPTVAVATTPAPSASAGAPVRLMGCEQGWAPPLAAGVSCR